MIQALEITFRATGEFGQVKVNCFGFDHFGLGLGYSFGLGLNLGIGLDLGRTRCWLGFRFTPTALETALPLDPLLISDLAW